LGNNLRNLWEPPGNNKNNQKIPPNPSPHRENLDPSWLHAWAFSLAAWNFYFQKKFCNKPGLMAGAQTVGHSKSEPHA
jgi:hypothetical protein